MKIKKENIIAILIIILTTISYFLFNQSPNILFATNILICILTIFKSKISLFSIKSILINYVLITIAYQYNTGTSYGLLSMNLYPLRYTTMYTISLIYNIILYLYISNSKVLQREREILKFNTKTNDLFSIICGTMGIIFAIVAFPSFKGARFNSLLPGNAWNHVSLIALLFALPSFKKNNFVKFSYLFTITWLLLHGERVDMIGLIAALMIYYIVQQQEKIKSLFNAKNIKYFIAAFCILILFIYVGEARAGNTKLDFNTISKKILISNTAADVGYVYNSSILYTEQYNKLYGKTYLLYIYKIIPFTSSKQYDAVAILQNEYNTAGGILLLSEPYMNFGFIGIIIFSLIELNIINFILKRKNNYTFYIYLFLLATQFRVTWYGLMYIEKGIIYIIPIIYTLYFMINNRKKVIA